MKYSTLQSPGQDSFCQKPPFSHGMMQKCLRNVHRNTQFIVAGPSSEYADTQRNVPDVPAIQLIIPTATLPAEGERSLKGRPDASTFCRWCSHAPGPLSSRRGVDLLCPNLARVYPAITKPPVPAAWNGRFCHLIRLFSPRRGRFRGLHVDYATPPGSPSSRVKGTGSAKVKRTVRALRIDIISPL